MLFPFVTVSQQLCFPPFSLITLSGITALSVIPSSTDMLYRRCRRSLTRKSLGKWKTDMAADKFNKKSLMWVPTIWVHEVASWYRISEQHNKHNVTFKHTHMLTYTPARYHFTGLKWNLLYKYASPCIPLQRQSSSSPYVKLCRGLCGRTLALCHTAPVRMEEKYLYLPDR